MDPVADNDRLNAARAKVMAALAEYADGWNVSEGGIVVSFVAIFEVATPSGEPALLEVCGTGPDGNQAIPAWRREGMLHNTLYGMRRHI